MINMDNRTPGEIDIESEIKVNYSYNKNPRRGYHCAYTEGMVKYGSPELCLMDYYPPEEAEFILLNMAGCVLNGELYDPDNEEYDFATIVNLADEAGNVAYIFGFIGGYLYEQEVMLLQELDDELFPIHPGEDYLPSYHKRGFEVWPLFMYVDDEEDEQEDLPIDQNR